MNAIKPNQTFLQPKKLKMSQKKLQRFFELSHWILTLWKTTFKPIDVVQAQVEPQPKINQAEAVVKEIISTETDYVNDLETCIEVSRCGLKVHRIGV